jgi:L-ascorbate metabolism protein UlaG (beta-lactamase superfamily)
MELRLFGHAAVGIRPEESPQASILIDPYEPGGFGGQLAYAPIDFAPDVILITHRHADHAHTAPFPGAPVLGPEDFAAGAPLPPWLRVARVAHDPYEGRLRGGWSWCLALRVDGLLLVHLGDIGECPPQETLDALTQGDPVDVLLATCGGFYTIGATQADELALRLRARLTIPIHHRTAACALPHLRGPEGLIARFGAATPARSPLRLRPDDLPSPGALWDCAPEGLTGA